MIKKKRMPVKGFVEAGEGGTGIIVRYIVLPACYWIGQKYHENKSFPEVFGMTPSSPSQNQEVHESVRFAGSGRTKKAEPQKLFVLRSHLSLL